MVKQRFFFFNDTATTEIYTLSLHDALPIFVFVTHDISLLIEFSDRVAIMYGGRIVEQASAADIYRDPHRSEEHTSELQSRQYLVCRLLLEKKKLKTDLHTYFIHLVTPDSLH